MKTDPGSFLELVDEIKIGDLLKGAGIGRFEASGIALKDGVLHIVFDDEPHLLRVHPDWCHADERPVLLELKGTGTGYEDIAYQSSTNRWYCLIEAAKTEPGIFRPHIDEFDESFAFVKSYRLDFPLKAGNKGFEGLSILRHSGNDYLLGLCEGNSCKSGSAGTKPGKGRIQVFKAGADTWDHTGTIRLPKAVRFKDYSSLDLRYGHLAVISQATSAMWIGHLCAQPGCLEDLFEDDGQMFLFPRDEKDRIIYGNVEGVTWLGKDRLAVVSDKAKKNQPGRYARKDQSIHIFRLPGASRPGD